MRLKKSDGKQKEKIKTKKQNLFLNIFSKTVNASSVIFVFIEDILFSIIASVVVTVFIFNINNGQVRWFALAGSAVGFFLYYMTVGKLIIFCAQKIISFIGAVVIFILRLTFIPIFKLLFFIYNLVYKLLSSVISKLYLKHCKSKTKRIKNKLIKEAGELFNN